MSLVELLPQIHSLERVEKPRLIQLLAQELAEGETDELLKPNQSYPAWSPERAFAAAETLLQVLHEDKGQP